MVRTRRSTQKSAIQTPIKTITKEKNVGKRSKLQNNLDRCKNWIQQQKKEKLKIEPDDLDSNESDEEQRDLNLAAISGASENEETVAQVLSSCEWQRCNRLFEKHSELFEHVVGHLPTIGDHFKCEWDLCDHVIDDVVKFKRHVGCHIYMTRLKTTGERLLHKRPMPPCMISSRGRNCIPSVDSKYICMWKDCSYTFDMVEDFYEHTRSHCVHELEFNKQGNRNKPVQCQWLKCKKMFDRRLKMTEHMRTHSAERFVACPNCGQTFNSYVKFYDHFRRQALNKSFKCYQCFQTFHTEELLNNHTAAHVNRVKCTECDMTCTSNAALTQHFRYRHLKERPYTCTECEYAAVTKWDLNKHQTRMHSTELTTYICDECDFTCSTINQIRKHNRNEHGDGPNVYCCHCCDKQYKNGSSLSQHLKNQHGFRLPSGHTRFFYQMDINGVYRVQTTRMESLEVSKQIMATQANDVAQNKNVTYTLGEFAETSDGITISVVESIKQKEASKSKETPKPKDTTKQKETTRLKETAKTKPSSTNQSDVKAQSVDLSAKKKTTAYNEIDSNTFAFMECLNLKSNHSESKELKNIDNFSVIKKYAKNKKRQKNRSTEYIIAEFDEQGNMIESQILPCDTEIETSNS
ncbi:histone H4 transcription factor [Sitodiplosis mosellana]|uniref:histone H4 transcription factor n=1 Tax=Sitodiplosis mosellana TaxID=263140 RepID=UPI00244384DD|nr:histone H4 transcription factor [Sitodiplosis mosellana]